MPLSKEKEDALRKEFHEWFQGNKTFYEAECSNWWLSKLSSALEEERERLMKGVEGKKKDMTSHHPECLATENGISYCDCRFPTYNSGFNDALSDVAKLISEGK